MHGVRGLAVLTVILFHMGVGSGWAPGHALPRAMFEAAGPLAVDVLFFTTGFVLFLPVVLSGGLGSVGAFAIRRFSRIAPPVLRVHPPPPGSLSAAGFVGHRQGLGARTRRLPDPLRLSAARDAFLKWGVWGRRGPLGIVYRRRVLRPASVRRLDVTTASPGRPCHRARGIGCVANRLPRPAFEGRHAHSASALPRILRERDDPQRGRS